VVVYRLIKGKLIFIGFVEYLINRIRWLYEQELAPLKGVIRDNIIYLKDKLNGY